MTPRVVRMAGFTLLPVILAMSLIAAIAFVLNRDNGMNAAMVATQMDADRARYAAEAGLQAANARVQTFGCAGGFPTSATPVTNTSFGSASYSAYASSASGNTTSLVSTGTYNGTSVTLTRNNVFVYQSPAKTYTLQPDAATGSDTFITANSPANFGPQNRVSLSSSDQSLVKFNLSMFPAGSLPVTGVMSLRAEFALAGGTANMYRMVSDWDQGTGSNGPANWTGRTSTNLWTTPGGDFHPVSAGSGLAIPSSWLDIDVADLSVAWLSGRYPNQGVLFSVSSWYGTLDLISSENSNATYRPKITFSYLLPCGTTGPVDTPHGTVTLNATADSFNDSGATSANNGGASTLKTYYTPTRENRTVIQFDASSIPAGAVVQSATLRMYVDSVGTTTGNTKNLWANAVDEPWVEGAGNNTNKACPGTLAAGTSWNYRTNCTNWGFIHPPNTAQAWSTMASMPTARYGHALVTVNNKIYAIGGMNGSSYYSVVQEYDPANNTWTTKTPMPTARALHMAVAINGKIYVIGGKNASTSLKVNEVYDPGNDTWTTMAAMPTARNGLAGAVVNDKIYAIGGASGVLLSSTPLTTNEEYDPATNTWTTKSAMTTARTNLTAATANSSIYVFGGWNGSVSLNKNEKYMPATNSWTGQSNLPAAADSMSSAVLGNQIYLIGGYRSGAINTVLMYDIWSNSYLTKANLPIAIQKTASATFMGRIYTMGGGSGSSAVSKHYQFDPGIPIPVATASDESSGTSPLAASFDQGWINFELKTLVQEWVDGVRPNNGVVIYTDGADQFNINSRQNVTNKPKLIITY